MFLESADHLFPSINSKDPDFNRRDLYESIEAGNFPEWELGVQIVKPEDAEKFDFDVLDSTKVRLDREIGTAL